VELVHRLRDGSILGRDPGGLAHHGAEASPGIGIGQTLAGDLREVRESLVDQGLEQVLLVREMPVDGADADSRGASELAHVDVEAVLGELLSRCGNDALAVAPRVGALRRLRLDVGCLGGRRRRHVHFPGGRSSFL
jgi:hypothetical protein